MLENIHIVFNHSVKAPPVLRPISGGHEVASLLNGQKRKGVLNKPGTINAIRSELWGFA